MASQPRLSRIERAVRAADASCDSAMRMASIQRFTRRLKYVKHGPAGRTSLAKVLGLEV